MMFKASENYVRKLVEEGLRVDERKFEQFRKIEVETNVIKTAEGSARVKIGNSHVLVGVKMDVGEPYPDIPEEGVLIVSTELVPLASPTFEPGPPDENAIELSRVVDRGIRESKSIQVEKLCIKPGEKVWMINLDIHVLDHDGNLIDAAALAAIAALLNTRIPKYEDGKIIEGEHSGKLPVIDKPVAVTIRKILNKLLIDTNLEEEEASDARITIATNQNGDICAIQKGGKEHFTTQELEQAVELATEKGNELREYL